MRNLGPNGLVVAISLGAAAALSACDGSSVGSEEVGNGVPGVAGDWAVFDGKASGRANQGTLIDGEFVGTDEVHFARGANADGLHHEQYYAADGEPPEPRPTPVEDDDVYRHATWGAFGADRAAHNGDYLLPTDTELWPDFTADLGLFRMEATASDLFIQVRFVSFPDPAAQIATVTWTPTIDSPALRDWPRNAGVASRFTTALTIWGQDAALVDASGVETLLSQLGGEVRVTDHAFEARIPLGSLPVGPWRVAVGAGLADPEDASKYWTVPAGAPTATSPGTDADTAPGSNVWDLMFTPHDPRYHDDHIQGDLLLAGDVSDASAVVDPAALRRGATIPAPVITGRIAHTYQSASDFGDGIVRGSPGTPPIPAAPAPSTVKPRDPAVNYEYTGALQPYFAYIPEAYPDSSHDWPLILYFHGLNNYIWEPFGLTLGLEDELESRGYLFASLLGRGDISFEGRGELDPLEVIEHMQERYRIDPQRIYLVGHSHGAGGVLNVARRNPDRFAAVVSAQITEAPAQPENFRYTPTIHIAGAQDPIDDGTSAQQRYDAISALGYDTQLLIYQSKTHENSSIHDALVEIFDLYDRSVMPVDPPTVVFTRGGGDFDGELGLDHDGAWWVSDMVAVDPSQDMRIFAESFAIPHARLDADAAQRSSNQIVDTQGPSGRSLGLLSATTPAFGQPMPAGNAAAFSVQNVAELTLDTDRMRLDLGAGNASIEVQLDSVTELRLAGGSGEALPWQALDSDGNTVASDTARRSAGVFSLSLPVATRFVLFPR